MTTPPAADAPTPRRARPLVTILVVVLVVFGCLIVLGGLLLYPAIRAAREAARASICQNNLKQIVMAIQTYNEAYRSYPPAYIADADGKPVHSWRLLILPYLGDPVGNEVYENYRFDEPWNSDHNTALAAKMPDVFRCPIDPDDTTETHYVVLVGEDTMWPGDQPTSFRDLRDGVPNVISVVEASQTAVPWLEPRDITPESFLAEIAEPGHRLGTTVATADGRVFRIRPDAPASLVFGMTTRAGGERIDESEVTDY
jgi:type II secretory pathway pseudopilin PulG